MIKTVITLFFAFSSFVSLSQKREWKEFDQYHDVMKIVFHSSAEGKMEPVKQNAEALLEKATSLKSSSIPEDVEVEKVKSLLNRLYSESAAINAMVKTQKPETDLKSAVEKAHNTFHELMAAAKMEHNEHK